MSKRFIRGSLGRSRRRPDVSACTQASQKAHKTRDLQAKSGGIWTWGGLGRSMILGGWFAGGMAGAMGGPGGIGMGILGGGLIGGATYLMGTYL